MVKVHCRPSLPLKRSALLLVLLLLLLLVLLLLLIVVSGRAIVSQVPISDHSRNTCCRNWYKLVSLSSEQALMTSDYVSLLRYPVHTSVCRILRSCTEHSKDTWYKDRCLMP
jgi:hypothetical protein